MDSSIGNFLDTNVVFDGTFEYRLNRKNFLKFLKGFNYKQLCIETVVSLEAVEVICETFQLITPIIRNAIFNSDWDNLDDKKRGILLSEISNNIDTDKEIINYRRLEFAQEAYKQFFPLCLTETKNDIQVLLRTIPDAYAANFRVKLDTLFEILQSYMEDKEYNNYNSTLRKINDDERVFIGRDTNDFKILCSLLSILQFGAHDFDYGEYHSFNNIKFYGRDKDFLTNLQKFKNLIEKSKDSSNHTDLVKKDINNFELIHPYLSNT